jgi:hypothetical protein
MQNPLKNLNIYIIIGGLFLIILGYVLMSTENFIDAREFSLSLYVSPPLIIAGHVVIAWGILARSKKGGSPTTAANDSKFSKASYN